MKLVIFIFWLEFLHKILIFDNVWMDEIFGNHELLEHALHCLFSQLGIVVDKPGFVNILALQTFHLALIDVSLGSASKLFVLLYNQVG